MARFTRVWGPAFSIACVAAIGGPTAARAQSPPARPAAPREIPDADPILDEARARLAEIRIRRGAAEAGQQAPWIEPADEPVLRYEDLTRENHRGSVSVWGATGRPRAVLDLFRGANELWVYAFTQLSDEAVVAERSGRAWWTPRGPVTPFKTLAVAAPAAAAPARTSQMRSLARRFAAHEFWDPDNSRFELRLLSTPLHRYQEPDLGVLDGGLFVFANGTNPEIALLLEARDDGTSRTWSYSLARMGNAELHVLWDGQEVWTLPRAAPAGPRDPYWTHAEQSGPKP